MLRKTEAMEEHTQRVKVLELEDKVDLLVEHLCKISNE